MALDLSNKKFGRLLAISPVYEDGYRKWYCICDCGNRHKAHQADLRNGKTRSCGCISKENILKIRITKHGNSQRKKRTTEYTTWINMRARCNNTKHDNYHQYGGRGINVCERWNDFKMFLKDMGLRPSSKYSIDRINNDGNYEPGNCRWATHKEQSLNKRDTVKVINNNGNIINLYDAAKSSGISYNAALYRSKHNIPMEKPKRR